jgi:hypothetical protein
MVAVKYIKVTYLFYSRSHFLYYEYGMANYKDLDSNPRM